MSGLYSDLEKFVSDHSSHGESTVKATTPAWNVDLITVTYPCGVSFARWVTRGLRLVKSGGDRSAHHLRALRAAPRA